MKSSKMSKYIAGGVLLFLGICFFCFWSGKKQPWFCDEIYTYESANGFEQEWPATMRDQWMTGRDVEDFFSADWDTLSLGEITVRLYCDHVPLYFWIFRIISFYFFKGSSSVWIGMSINLVFYIVFLVAAYAVFCRIFKNPYSAACVVFLSCVMHRLVLEQATTLRMYMMLLCMELLLLVGAAFLLFCGYRSKKRTLLILVYLYAVSLIGFLTHYDFWIFYAATAGCACLWLLVTGFAACRKEHRKFWKHPHIIRLLLWVGNFLASILSTIAIFPYCRWNLNRGKGQAALNSVFVFSQKKVEDIIWGYRRLSGAIFGDRLPMGAGLLLLFGCIAAGLILLWRQNRRKEFHMLLLTTLICQGYQLVVCFTMPDVQEERYLWGSFTMLLFGMLASLVLLLQALFTMIREEKIRKFAGIAATAVCLLFGSLWNWKLCDEGRGITYLFDPNKDMELLLANRQVPWIEYGPTIGVYSYYDWILPERICFLSDEHLPEDVLAASRLQGEERFILYVYEDFVEDAVSFLSASAGENYTYERVCQSGNLTVFLCTAQKGQTAGIRHTADGKAKGGCT